MEDLLAAGSDLASVSQGGVEDGLQEEDGLMQEDGLTQHGSQEDGWEEDGLQEDGWQEDGSQEDGSHEQASLLRADILKQHNEKEGPPPHLSRPGLRLRQTPAQRDSSEPNHRK